MSGSAQSATLRRAAATARSFARAAAVEPGEPAILTCAVSGDLATGNPNQPITRDDVVREAVAAARAGASILHIHARSADGASRPSAGDYVAIKQEVLAEVGEAVLNFTTAPPADGPAGDRGICLAAQPEMATLNCGSVNLGPADLVLSNPPSAIREMAEAIAASGALPEYECFDLGMAATAARLARDWTGPAGMIHILLGIEGAAPASVETISLFLRLVPDGVPWAATSVARHLPIMAAALAMGGHVRTGLEDVVYVAPGEHARSNEQLVDRARVLCEAVGRPVATPGQAREILGLRPSTPA